MRVDTDILFYKTIQKISPHPLHHTQYLVAKTTDWSVKQKTPPRRGNDRYLFSVSSSASQKSPEGSSPLPHLQFSHSSNITASSITKAWGAFLCNFVVFTMQLTVMSTCVSKYTLIWQFHFEAKLVVIIKFCNPNLEADPMSTCVAPKKILS